MPASNPDKLVIGQSEPNPNVGRGRRATDILEPGHGLVVHVMQ